MSTPTVNTVLYDVMELLSDYAASGGDRSYTRGMSTSTGPPGSAPVRASVRVACTDLDSGDIAEFTVAIVPAASVDRGKATT